MLQIPRMTHNNFYANPRKKKIVIEPLKIITQSIAEKSNFRKENAGFTTGIAITAKTAGSPQLAVGSVNR